MTTQDYSTFNFLQWYVAEQHEEEKLFKSILDKLAMVGDSGKLQVIFLFMKIFYSNFTSRSLLLDIRNKRL